MINEKAKSGTRMEWLELSEEAELHKINEMSKQQPVMLFKHSTRCSISDTALNRVERAWNKESSGGVLPYYLDLIAHRSLSNKVAEAYNIKHESPQVLLIKDGKCIYHASHLSINLQEVISKAS